jgi:FdhD protein
MEIRVHGPGEEPRPLAVTMRTPGSDFELAVGFLLAEGLLSGPADLDTVAYCVGPEGIQQYNVVTVRLRAPVGDRLRARNVLTTSACGVCGAASIDDIATHAPPVGSGPEVRTEVLHGLTEVLGGAQRAFGATGGVHAAARFGPTGDLRAVREDVGRHNALDKLVGHATLAGALPLTDDVLLVSGRLSFELVQKAAVAGIPVVCAIGAPSNLAVATAERFGQTVVAFLRDGRANIYSHPERIVGP